MMTDEELKKFIIKELRRAFRRAPMYTEALKRAKVSVQVGFFQNGKPKYLQHYKCAQCQSLFPCSSKEKKDKVAVDHIKPIVDVAEGFLDWNTFIPSLYCSLDNLQVLCNFPKQDDGSESCHKIKTRIENQNRPKKPKKKKEK